MVYWRVKIAIAIHLMRSEGFGLRGDSAGSAAASAIVAVALFLLDIVVDAVDNGEGIDDGSSSAYRINQVIELRYVYSRLVAAAAVTSLLTSPRRMLPLPLPLMLSRG